MVILFVLHRLIELLSVYSGFWRKLDPLPMDTSAQRATLFNGNKAVSAAWQTQAMKNFAHGKIGKNMLIASKDSINPSDILAHAAGSEWRVESFGFNPIANLPVQNIGIDIVNGMVSDYTVRVTDQDGSFYVWARNLDRALSLQAKQGTSLAFNLRNYEVDFAKLQQQVDSSDDSKYRIELLTPAEFSFALKLSSIEFQPQMLTATLNNATGVISYSVNTLGLAHVATATASSSIDQMISLLDPVFKEYVAVSRAAAVRMALQGGLSSFAQGLRYDVAQDKYISTTNKQLAPMFTAILNAAPGDNTGNAIDHYLSKWNEILWEVYPDYVISGGNSILGAAVAFDQTFILQQVIEAFEASTINYDIRGIAHNLAVDESKIITTTLAEAQVTGTDKTDYIYITPGDHIYTHRTRNNFTELQNRIAKAANVNLISQQELAA